MTDHTFTRLSDFYIDLWSYLTTYFNDTRWLEIHANGTSHLDRFKHLDASYRALQHDVTDGTLIEQISQDYDELRHLISDYKQDDASALSGWLCRAEKMRLYSQKLGLRYAEMAANQPLDTA